MSELAKRTLFAVAAIPVVGLAVWFGGAPLTILLSIASALAAWEFSRMAQAAGYRPFARTMTLLAALVPLSVHASRLGYFIPPLPWVALLMPTLLAVALWRRGVEGKPLAAVATTLIGVWYTGGMLAFVYALRYHRFVVGALAGTLLVAFPVVLTWLNDSGAFFAGRAFGKRKLMPSISPGKTWAGAVGGMVVTVIAAWAFVRFVLMPFAGLGLSLGAAVLVGVVISAAAQIGDLAESLLKREAGVKDSSSLIPGHGGVLDRTDSLLFTVPVAFVLLDFLLRVGA